MTVTVQLWTVIRRARPNKYPLDNVSKAVSSAGSWVKMGPEGVKACLDAGANDLGGTLMNESITRAAGTVHGQEMLPERMEALINQTGRIPKQRDTLYRNPDPVQKSKSYGNHQLVTKEFQNSATDSESLTA